MGKTDALNVIGIGRTEKKITSSFNQKGRASHEQKGCMQCILPGDNMYGELYRGNHGEYTVETDYDVKVA